MRCSATSSGSTRIAAFAWSSLLPTPRGSSADVLRELPHRKLRQRRRRSRTVRARCRCAGGARPVTVCALNGSVYGGATDLMLACDLCVALAGIEFRTPATAPGLHYYPSGLQCYVARLGAWGAKRAFLTARPFTAERLPRMGCLEEVADAPDFNGAVARLDCCARAAGRAIHQALARRDRDRAHGHGGHPPARGTHLEQSRFR